MAGPEGKPVSGRNCLAQAPGNGCFLLGCSMHMSPVTRVCAQV